MTNTPNRRWNYLVLACALALSACAQNETAPADEQPLATAEQPAPAPDPVPAEPSPPAQEPAAPAGPDYASMNPVPVTFETLSVKLNDADLAVLEQLRERAQAADRITVRGYCDRTQVENAKEVAIARGVAVRAELARLGVDRGKIRIRYSTETPKHAAEIEFHTGS